MVPLSDYFMDFLVIKEASPDVKNTGHRCWNRPTEFCNRVVKKSGNARHFFSIIEYRPWYIVINKGRIGSVLLTNQHFVYNMYCLILRTEP